MLPFECVFVWFVCVCVCVCVRCSRIAENHTQIHTDKLIYTHSHMQSSCLRMCSVPVHKKAMAATAPEITHSSNLHKRADNWHLERMTTTVPQINQDSCVRMHAPSSQLDTLTPSARVNSACTAAKMHPMPASRPIHLQFSHNART